MQYVFLVRSRAGGKKYVTRLRLVTYFLPPVFYRRRSSVSKTRIAWARDRFYIFIYVLTENATEAVAGLQPIAASPHSSWLKIAYWCYLPVPLVTWGFAKWDFLTTTLRLELGDPVTCGMKFRLKKLESFSSRQWNVRCPSFMCFHMVPACGRWMGMPPTAKLHSNTAKHDKN